MLFEGILWTLFFPLILRVKFTSVDVLTLCFSEKLPATGNLAFKFRGQWPWIKWTRFSPSNSECRSNNSALLRKFLVYKSKSLDQTIKLFLQQNKYQPWIMDTFQHAYFIHVSWIHVYIDSKSNSLESATLDCWTILS